MNTSLRFKRYLKIMVRLLERVLPKTLFDKFYAFAFPQYKILIRFAYMTKSLIYLLKRDREGWLMAQKIYLIMPYTLVGIRGLEVTYKLCKMMNEKNIKGNFVELGVARGGCAALMAEVAFNSGGMERQLWLFDSFEGLPDPTDDDYSSGNTGEHVRPLPKGSCLGTIEDVQTLLFSILNYPNGKIYFVKGWFQNTLPIRHKDVKDIAVLRIDGDWYESTKYCLEYLYYQVVSGGVVIIDDYQTCYGCKKAVDEFISKNNIHANMMFDGRGGCYFIKPYSDV